MSYWDVYNLPVPIRHYYIRRVNKHKEQENSINKTAAEDMSKPLPSAEKLKFKKEAQQISNQNLFPSPSPIPSSRK